MRHHPIMFSHAQDRNGNEFGSEIRTDLLDQHWRNLDMLKKSKASYFQESCLKSPTIQLKNGCFKDSIIMTHFH